MRTSTTVVYCAIDSLISPSNKALAGFSEFLESLTEAGIPCIWVSSRNRMFLDATIRKFGHSAPFIAENGCGVYLPEDYFHLKPGKTTRLGRFTCIPVAKPLPAAREALESLVEDAGLEVVPLRSLSPRELSQNVGLPQREAELLRQRDFDELFFFAGATDEDIRKFREEAAKRNLSLHTQGVVWSLATGADMPACVRDLSKLYDRATRAHVLTIALGTPEDAAELFPTCNRAIELTAEDNANETAGSSSRHKIPLFASETWDSVLEAVQTRRR